MKKIPKVEEYLMMPEEERKEWAEDIGFLASLDERLNRYLKYRPDLNAITTRPVIVCGIDTDDDAQNDTILCHENTAVKCLTDEALDGYHKIFTENNRNINIRLVQGYVTINKDAPNKVHLSISKKHTINRLGYLNKRDQIVNNFENIPNAMRWATVYNSPESYISSKECLYGKACEIDTDDDGTQASDAYGLPGDTPIFHFGKACVEWDGSEADLRLSLCESLKKNIYDDMAELLCLDNYLKVGGLTETEEWEGE